MNTPVVHFAAPYLLNPTNPITVNLIGAGGTGCQALYHLGRTDGALRALGHPGLFVRVFDGDKISRANVIRQRFSDNEVGFNKAVVLINKINRDLGIAWKAVPYKYCSKNASEFKDQIAANVTISCIDTIKGRFEIASILQGITQHFQLHRSKPYYWMDLGNDRYTGQVILSTVENIKQPKSTKFITASNLPFVTTEFKDLLTTQKKTEKNTPSCSLAQALDQQDLFINPAVANASNSLLWNLIRSGLTEVRGIFLNVKTYRSIPLLISGD